MLFGPADIKYHRAVQPEPFTMVSVKKGNREMSFIEKVKRFIINGK